MNLSNPGTSSAARPAEAKPAARGGIKSFLDWLIRLVENFDAILLAAMTLVICWEIIGRFFAKYIDGINSPWTEEIATMMMVWFGLTGAAIGIRQGSHIGVEFLVNLFHKKLANLVAIVVGLVIIGFSWFLLIEGMKFVKEMMAVDLPATGLSRGLFVYMAVPVTAVLMILYALEVMFKDFKLLLAKEEK